MLPLLNNPLPSLRGKPHGNPARETNAAEPFISVYNRTCKKLFVPQLLPLWQEILYDPRSGGVPTVSPRRHLISEVFIELFEREVFESGNQLLNYVVYWPRNVKDIMCFQKWASSLLNKFLEMLNSKYTTIKFTIEIEGENIVFLDRGHTFSISRDVLLPHWGKNIRVVQQMTTDHSPGTPLDKKLSKLQKKKS